MNPMEQKLAAFERIFQEPSVKAAIASERAFLSS
jgi:hypothetical protein